MQQAIEEAKKTKKDIPVGAVIVRNGKIIARAHNTKEETNDVTSHAEILALKEASKVLNNWRLDDCELYVTLEPCPMCTWAILDSRIKAIYFGSYDSQYGAMGSKIDLTKISKTNTKIYGGIKEYECNQLIDEFFKKIRK